MSSAEHAIRPDQVDILIAEDSPTQAEQLRSLLARQGYRVTVAVNGREALRGALAHPPTLIITDIVMPEMDGYELCSAIKADPKLNEIPVIMVTSLTGIQDIAKSLECGADNFIRKPYESKKLLTRIEYILLNRELRKSSKLQIGMELYFGGKTHFIASGREQIVDLLISTYEEAVQMNEELQRQRDEIAQSNRNLRTLYRVAGDMNHLMGEDEVCELALRALLEITDFEGGWIFLDNGHGELRVGATSQLPAVLLAPDALEGDCRCRRMLSTSEVNRHGAALVDCERLARCTDEDCDMHAHLCIPLTTGTQPLGILNLVAQGDHTTDAEGLRMLDAIGSQVALAIQRAQLYGQLETLVEQRTAALRTEIIERTRAEQRVASLNRIYAVLSGINTTIVRVHDRATLFREACRISVGLGKFRLAWIGLLDSTGSFLEPATWMDDDADENNNRFELSVNDRVDLQQGLFARALRERATATCNDLSASTETQFPANAAAQGCLSKAVFPLLLDDQPIGALALYSGERDVFDAMELALLNEMAGDISFALGHIRNEEKLDYLAYYDTLTGLPNRRLIQDRLQQLLHVSNGEEHRTVALVIINVDRFRNINDTFGRHVGDALLKVVAHRLGEAMGGTDHIARIGNDHFAAILDNAEDATEVAHRLEAPILTHLGRSFDIEGHDLHVTVKIGVAMFPGDGKEGETLFAHAETAMRKAAVSQERYLFYAPEMNARVAEQLTLENKLHRAQNNGEFVLHYQPKVELNYGRIIGFEALLRWQDPEGGLVRPDAFIPILEETGLIIDVGRWALEQAAADHAAWQHMGLQPPPVAVNVSAVQIRRADFLPELEKVLSAREGQPGCLHLELTESLLMEDIDVNIRRLGAIREMGLKIAIDDFGTGYSSLSYLKRFPIDYLKIDQGFVRDITTDPDAAAICIAVINLAHNLRLTVIAEGVETESQMQYLRRHRCDEIQGYLFSRPVPFEDIGKMLKAHKVQTLHPESTAGARQSLLLVDDEPHVLSALKRALRGEGYDVFAAGSAAEGLDILAAHDVQVIISDQRMPEMSGVEFLSRVRELHPESIRIVLSGYTELSAVIEAVNRGAIYRFLTKPWDDEQLREHVREAFRYFEAGERR